MSTDDTATRKPEEQGVNGTQPNGEPEQVEEALVKESVKAGVPAFQFDPASPPQEKARAAREAILPETRLKRPKALTLTTDRDATGPDQYDLPSTKKATEMAVKSPAPTEKSTAPPNGTDEELTEDNRWAADRTGWAPQFAQPDTEEGAEDETLLDHRTFLEGKLDDKFFGDWYHNAGVIIFACLASWSIAVLGGGIGWVILVMAACGTYYRTSIRRVRRNFRDDINRELAKQRLETDTETLEWINSFLVKFWPIYAPILCDSIINSVDQVLSTATPSFLESLRLKTFILGSKPPRLEHVKTYPKTEVDTVIMDWKFSFTPNDIMDLTARQLKNKINPKVVLEVRVGKGVVSKGLDVIVEDFACSGLMRVKVKLQVAFPHIERVDISFLGRPEIDYVCKPLGGDTLGFDINFIPGLESFIKEQIHGNLGPMMYEPNVFPIEVAKMLAGSPIDRAIGVLAVTLHGAANLKGSSTGTDPYAVLSLNNRNELARTKTVHDTCDPRWNETLYIVITSFSDTLTIHLWDYNEFRKDKELGVATFPLDRLEEEQEHENLSLEVTYSGRKRGVVHVDVRFFPVLEGRKLENGEVEPPPELNTGIARFTVEQAKELDGSKSLVGALNPYAVLLLNGKEVHVSKKLKRTNNPIFQNSSKELLITDRKTARLGLVIKDDRDLVADPIVGKYQIKVNDMLKMMEKGQQWFHLHGTKTGRVKMTLDWKPVALRGVAGGTGYINPIGVIRLHLHSANDLRNLETMGKSDPYVRVLLSGVTKRRTVTFKNNLNPTWDEVLYVPVHSPREKLTLEVMDEEKMGKDRSLGEVEVSLSDYIRENENGEYEVDDEKQLLRSGLRLHGRGQVKGYLNYTVAFYPTYNVVDPDEETEEDEEAEGGSSALLSPRLDRKSSDLPRKSNDLPRTSTDASARPSLDTTVSKPLSNGETASISSQLTKEPPKIYIGTDDLTKYESGLVVFKLLDAQLSHSDVYLEVVVDDHLFPHYTSMKLKSKEVTLQDVGEAFIRELEMSQLTLRLVSEPHQDKDSEVIARLSGPTLATLQRSLYTPVELTLRSDNGSVSKVKVSTRYIPVRMKLDPKESINNSGTLRVDVLDAADLPSADRNGYSDPYCKFRLAGEEVYKTKVQKKTLHPAWNEFFETNVKSRIGADFRVDVYDWDFGDKADYLGGAPIDLEALEPFRPKEISLPLDGKSGAIRLKLLFKPSYVTRSKMGTSTFSGTFATPGKIVGAPVKTVGMVGGGVIKGASFLGRGLMNRIRGDKDDEEAAETMTPPREESPPRTPPQSNNIGRAPALVVDGPSGDTATPDSSKRRHSRARSVRSVSSQAGGDRGGELGTAMFTISSALDYPTGKNIRVVVRVIGPKGPKDVHKTKTIKNNSGAVQFDASHESFRVPNVSADAQFQLRVLDHSTFGSDDVLGETLFFVDDQGSLVGRERTLAVGDGRVVLKSSFVANEPSGGRPSTAVSVNGDGADGGTPPTDTPESKKSRRNLLLRRSVSAAHN
ncbi:hypothetical protein VTN31DRAFT_352 [Thermomyces dupontii]|uniref:uncharacterized protein n=1 Tax=Talaromyces thermophilus TaxID=28565 RepID=UPI003741ED7E